MLTIRPKGYPLGQWSGCMIKSVFRTVNCHISKLYSCSYCTLDVLRGNQIAEMSSSECICRMWISNVDCTVNYVILFYLKKKQKKNCWFNFQWFGHLIFIWPSPATRFAIIFHALDVPLACCLNLSWNVLWHMRWPFCSVLCVLQWGNPPFRPLTFFTQHLFVVKKLNLWNLFA